MKVTLIGDGKMSRAVQRLAPRMGHEVVRALGRADNPPGAGFSGEWARRSEALIDFSLPDAVEGNVEKALEANLPIVIGTTGWYERLEVVRRKVEGAGGAALYASNFSVGVQVLFVLARQAARLLSRFDDYDPYLWEAHHRHKLDAPSGTARTLQRILGEAYGREVDAASVRAGAIPGTHVVGFDSPADTLRLEHSARSRDGFAAGSLLAAEWLKGKKGFHTMEEVIKEKLE